MTRIKGTNYCVEWYASGQKVEDYKKRYRRYIARAKGQVKFWQEEVKYFEGLLKGKEGE